MNTSSPASPGPPTTGYHPLAPGPTSAAPASASRSMSVSVPSPTSDEGNDSHSLPSPGVDEGISYTSGSGSGSGSGVGAGTAAPKGNTNTSTDANGWKKRVSTACLACKKSKRKVSIALTRSVLCPTSRPGPVLPSPNPKPSPSPSPKLIICIVLRHHPLRQLPHLQSRLHLRRIARPAPARGRKAHSRRAELPPRPAERSLQAGPRRGRAARAPAAGSHPSQWVRGRD